MCECYQVGGRFIAEDPNCPRHGDYAVKERERNQNELDKVYKSLATLIRIVEHYGANKTEKGEPHPQAQALEEAKHLLDNPIDLE